MKIRIERLLLALMFAFVFAGATFMIVDAQGGTPPQATNITYDNCVACHKDVQETWQNGSHGNATGDPIFTKA
jgi:hypothetical protein